MGKKGVARDLDLRDPPTNLNRVNAIQLPKSATWLIQCLKAAKLKLTFPTYLFNNF